MFCIPERITLGMHKPVVFDVTLHARGASSSRTGQSDGADARVDGPMVLINTNFPKLQSSTCMVVTKLASQTTLTANLVDTLVKELLKFAQSGA